jgi:hypothetical protein
MRPVWASRPWSVVTEAFTIEADFALYGEGDIDGGTGDWSGVSGHYESFGFYELAGYGGRAADWVLP